ncbi:MAG: hypothetical protein GEU76_00755 [Alphaproteobacteria bacterium]|nr:hypothetical protein [Alphaproteobacteria bacterium]
MSGEKGEAFWRTIFEWLPFRWLWWLLMALRRGITGVEFYPDRHGLDRIRPLTDELRRVTEAHVFWVAGRKQFQSGEQLEKIKRLILPNPDSASLKCFESSLPDGMSIRDQIREVTQMAIEKGIQVKWYSEFIGYSWWIADPSGKNAFAHLEIAMPFSRRDRRPSIRISRSRHPEAFSELWNSYEKIWEKSESQNGAR